MAGSGLIAIEKMVERLGKAHKQRYWVKPEELRGLVKKGNARKAVERAGGDADRLEGLIQGWRASPGTSETATMRAACAKVVYKDKGSMIQKEMDRSTRAAEKAANIEYDVKDVGKYVGQVSRAFQKGLSDEGLRRDIAAVAAVSQSLYEKPSVDLWRGIRGNSSLAYLYEEAYEAVQEDPDAEITLDSGVLSSFSESPEVAQTFAALSSAAGEEGSGFYFKVTVPRESIVMTHRLKGDLDPGNEGEQEVTVLTSGSIKIRARDIVQAQDRPGRGLEIIAKKAERGEYTEKKEKKSTYSGTSLEDYARQYLGRTRSD
jgi:hypothetical protein